MAYIPTIPVTLTDPLDNPVGTPAAPIWVTGVVAASNLSIGPNGIAVPADSTQVGGPDGAGILHASQVLNSNPLGAEYGTVTRDVNLALGTAKAMVSGTGTPGFPAAGVMTIQGIAGGTPIPVSGTFSAPSVGLTGAAVPTSADQIGGPDAGGLLRAPRVLPTDPLAGDFGLVTRDVGLATGTAKLAANQSVNVAQIAGTNTVTGGVAGLLAIAGAAASGVAKSGNPVQVGGVFNTTQPTVTTGQTVEAQSTARGALIVATGVDTLNATVSGTVTANIGTTNGLALDATLTGGTQKAIMRGGAKGATAAADVTSTAEGTDHQAADVQLYSGGVAINPTQIRALTNTDVVSLSALVNAVPASQTAGTKPVLQADAASGALRVSDTTAPISAFGWPITVEPVPITRQHFTYGINPRVTRTLLSAGATAVGTGNAGNGADLQLSIPNTANAFAIARSYKPLHYRAGEGQLVELTTAFNAGVANSFQFGGAWAPDAAYIVCYNGTSWGFAALTGGAMEIRTLTVSTAATGGGNVTITLDGTAVTVAVTNQTGNPSRTAWEISQGNFAAAGGAGSWGWDAYALGAVVYFVSRRSRVNGGAFTFGAGATGSAAAFATVRAGVAENYDFGSPSVPGNWTFLDPLDGTGPSGLNFNFQNGIIWGFSIGHLGHRGCRVFVIHPITGRNVLVADYRFEDTSTASALQNPTLHVAWGIVSNGSTTAMTMTGGSGNGSIEGRVNDGLHHEGRQWGAWSAKTAALTNGTTTHILSVRAGPVFGAGGQTPRASRTELHIKHMTVGNNGAAGTQYCDIEVYLNPTLSNLAAFTQLDSSTLALWVWQDLSTLTSGTVTGGQRIAAVRVPSAQVIQLDMDIVLDDGDIISVVTTASSSNQMLDVGFQGWELQ